MKRGREEKKKRRLRWGFWKSEKWKKEDSLSSSTHGALARNFAVGLLFQSVKKKLAVR